MLTFKYGADQMDNYIHFVDGQIPGNGFIPHGELLYGVDVINGEQTIVTFFEDIGAQCTCEVIDRKGVTVDKLTELIRVDMPVGSNVKIPDVLVSYVRQTGDEVCYDGRHYHWATYMYGKFDGRNRINVYNGKLRTFDRFDTQECLYCVMEGAPRIVGSQSYTDLVELKERDGGYYYAGNSGVEVYAPTMCSVNIPRLIKQDMREHGYEDALFVPIHVDGKWDIKSQTEETPTAQVTYKYGKFNGRNRVDFHTGSAPAYQFYRDGETIYRVSVSGALQYIELTGATDVCHTNVVNGKCYDATNPSLEIYAPAGCDVKVPRCVRSAIEEYGDTDALFIPIHVDGTKDWFEEDESNLGMKSVERAFQECRHLTGPERFRAMMPLLKGVEVYCLGDLTGRESGDLDIVDVYGVEVPCRVQISPKRDVRYKVLVKDGESQMMTSSAEYPFDIILDEEFTVRGEQVIITDRPIGTGTRIKTALSSLYGNVILIEVPPEVAVEGFDILPELQRLCSDEEYRKKVSEDIQKVFMTLPPSQRRQESAIAQVCELATLLAR